MAVFSQKKNPEPVVPAQAPTTIGQSSLAGKTLLIKGDIYSEDEIVIEGRIQGKITVKNRVIIGRNADVEAEIEAREIVIRGKVVGNVRGSQRVEIAPAGTLHGNIQAPRVVIADSGFFDGNIEMRPREEKSKIGDEKTAGAAPQNISLDGERPESPKPFRK